MSLKVVVGEVSLEVVVRDSVVRGCPGTVWSEVVIRDSVVRSCCQCSVPRGDPFL